MTCPSCEHHVEQALREAGAMDATADFRRNQVIFTTAGEPDQSRLKTAVQASGYVPGDMQPLPNSAHDRMPIEGMTCGDCERHVVEASQENGAGARTFEQAVARTGYQPGRVESIAPERLERHTNSRGGGDHYDLAIVGSGGGAFAAAIAAAERGARVVMIERGTLGGTCVNIGCVPSKTQLRAGELFWHAGHQPFAGIRTRTESVDLPTLVQQKDELVAALRKDKYADLIDDYGWELVRGEARFDDPTTLSVDGRAIRADGFVLATGARPEVPAIPGLSESDYLTSTSLLDLDKLPEHLVVIGAGYVGLELGQLFRHLGSRVTLMQRSERLLKGYDPELGEAMHDILIGEGMEVITGATFRRVEQSGSTRRVLMRLSGNERSVEGDALLVATGRTPNTEALNLAAAGVRTGGRGEILVDEYLRSSNPRVFAAGDVTLGPQYVYVAAREGAVAAENALGGLRAVDLRAVPGVTFTTPSVATVGLTEAAARQAEHETKVAVLPLHAVPRALVNRDERGLFKVVADAHTDEILGVHIIAENAGEAIYAGVLAVRFHLTVKDLTDTFAPYLTMSEGLKLAAQTFDRDVSRLSCCAA